MPRFLHLLVLFFALPGLHVLASVPTPLPGALQVGPLLYQASMANAKSVAGWRMEGPGEVAFKDGWMHMQSPDEEMHHVFWCPERFPTSFIAQWDAQNLETDAGLCIVFFAAAALDGDGSIFDEDLSERDGTFSQYTKGAIRCYHTSYYANAAHNPDRQQTNLRKNPGFRLVAEGEEGIPTKSEAIHKITLAKLGPRIRLWVDDKKVIDWTDTGEHGGPPHTDGFIGFRQMQWTHFRYRNFRVWEAADLARSADPTRPAAIQRRRQMSLAKAAENELRLRVRNGKQTHPIVLARLATGTADEASKRYLAHSAGYRAKGSMFGMSSLAGIYCRYEDQLPEDVRQAIRDQVLTYPHFLGGGTENHVTMKRAAGLLFGERFPDDTFHHDISGRELAFVCKDYVRNYGQRVYASSLYEYLSPVYFGVHLRPWLHVAECSEDDETQLMARALTDWLMVDLALNTHHGVSIPPVLRDRGMLLTGNPKLNHHKLSATQAIAWLFWGQGVRNAVPRELVNPTVMSEVLAAEYVPHPAIRNLGAKNVRLPYMLRQARTSKRFLEPSYVNPHGYPALTGHPEYGPDTPRNHFRCVYVAEDYALGTGNFRENIFDSQLRTNVPFGAVWRSPDANCAMIVAHPYFYPDKPVGPWAGPSPHDMWSGTSPFQQTVHWENTAIVLFDIPDRDPYAGANFRWGAPIMKPVKPRENPIQSCFAYFAETVDQRVQTDAGFFLREGDVYVAIRPLAEGAQWNTSKMDGYDRIDMPGGVTGCVVEIGDKDEYGLFDAFQDRVAKAELDASALSSDTRVSYVSTRGHKLDIKFNHDGWLPHASINGTSLDFESWPICESPYVTCDDRVLHVHDGREGLSIDWRGEAPIYTYFDIVDGERRVTAREYLGADGRLIREKEDD